MQRIFWGGPAMNLVFSFDEGYAEVFKVLYILFI